LLKLAKCRPAWTIQAQPGSSIGPFHWKNRRLSATELIRLQTFPADFRVLGGRTEVQRQIGNAVPSLMTEILGRAIRAQLLDRPIRAGTPLKLIPARRTPQPAADPIRPVPRKYRRLVGEHAPHPGTGKGHLVRASTA
jgi:DNA (cytosine-5)-methyltransferase 1